MFENMQDRKVGQEPTKNRKMLAGLRSGVVIGLAVVVSACGGGKDVAKETPADQTEKTTVNGKMQGADVKVAVRKPEKQDRSYLDINAAKTAIGDQKKNRMNANYHFNQANSLREKEKYAEAAEEYKRAIRAYPADGAFYKNLGGTFAMIGEFDEAEAVLKKGCEISPDDWLMWNNLAVVLQKLGKNEACQKAINESMKLDPPEYAKENMALTLKQLGKSTN